MLVVAKFTYQGQALLVADKLRFQKPIQMFKSLVYKIQMVLTQNWISQALCQAILVKRHQIQRLVLELQGQIIRFKT